MQAAGGCMRRRRRRAPAHERSSGGGGQRPMSTPPSHPPILCTPPLHRAAPAMEDQQQQQQQQTAAAKPAAAGAAAAAAAAPGTAGDAAAAGEPSKSEGGAPGRGWRAGGEFAPSATGASVPRAPTGALQNLARTSSAGSGPRSRHEASCCSPPPLAAAARAVAHPRPPLPPALPAEPRRRVAVKRSERRVVDHGPAPAPWPVYPRGKRAREDVPAADPNVPPLDELVHDAKRYKAGFLDTDGSIYAEHAHGAKGKGDKPKVRAAGCCSWGAQGAGGWVGERASSKGCSCTCTCQPAQCLWPRGCSRSQHARHTHAAVCCHLPAPHAAQVKTADHRPRINAASCRRRAPADQEHPAVNSRRAVLPGRAAPRARAPPRTPNSTAAACSQGAWPPARRRRAPVPCPCRPPGPVCAAPRKFCLSVPSSPAPLVCLTAACARPLLNPPARRPAALHCRAASPI